jgi:hypothetical protein
VKVSISFIVTLYILNAFEEAAVAKFEEPFRDLLDGLKERKNNSQDISRPGHDLNQKPPMY